MTPSKYHRHAEHGYVHPPRRPQLWPTVTPTAFAANRHAEQVASKPSRLTQLWQTVTQNAFAANRHAEHGCQQTATLNAFAESRHAELDSASINSPPTDSHPSRRF